MKRIAMIFPYTPSYRDLIYRKMDEEFDVDWFFCGNAERPMKLMDYSRLKKCDISMTEERLVGSIHKYDGIKKLNLDHYDVIIVPSVIRCTSTWWLVLHYGGGKRGPKLYFWTHGWYGKEKGIIKFIKKLYYSKVDGFFLYNQRGRNIMANMGYDESRLHVIYNSLDYDKQLPIRNSLIASNLFQEHFGNTNHNIIFIGRLTKVKRLDLLIDAVSLLIRRGEPVNVTLIGDGEERDNIKSLIKKNGIEKYVWLYGACYDEKTNAELIYNADLCVSPGNIGLTAIHVLMFGCPAITNDDFDSQMPEFESIKDGKTGTFFKSDSSKSLAESISLWFAKHTNDREHIRQQCYYEIDTLWNPNNQIHILKEALSI